MYKIYKIKELGIIVIPEEAESSFLALGVLELNRQVELLFKGTWQQCMVFMINPISCN